MAALLAMELADGARMHPAARDREDDRGTAAQFAVALGAALAASAVATASSRRWPLPRHRIRWWTGISLAWAGAGLTRLARRQLGPAYRPLLTVVDDHELVVDGPYRIVRHPMHAGGGLIALGAALAVDHPVASAAWVLPLTALIRRIGIEEHMLREALGSDYDTFACGRARLVPGVW